MLIRSLFLAIFLMPPVSAVAAEQFIVNFKLTQGKRVIERDNFYVEKTQHLWTKGINRTYVKLSCIKNKSGELEKKFSMSEIFTGYRIIHILDGDEVKLTVVRKTVVPALKEIRTLADNECRELSPITTIITKQYKLSTKTAVSEEHAFDDKLTLHLKLNEIASSKNL